MRHSWLATAVPGLLAIAGLGLLTLWPVVGRFDQVQARMPGVDGAPSLGSTGKRELVAPGKPVRSEGRPYALPGSWPWFRGPNRDAICDDGTPLARNWQGGPEKLWQVDLGEGYAAASVHAGCLKRC